MTRGGAGEGGRKAEEKVRLERERERERERVFLCLHARTHAHMQAYVWMCVCISTYICNCVRAYKPTRKGKGCVHMDEIKQQAGGQGDL